MCEYWTEVVNRKNYLIDIFTHLFKKKKYIHIYMYIKVETDRVKMKEEQKVKQKRKQRTYVVSWHAAAENNCLYKQRKTRSYQIF